LTINLLIVFNDPTNLTKLQINQSMIQCSIANCQKYMTELCVSK